VPRLATTLSALTAASFGVSCGSTDSVNRADLETKVRTELGASVGQAAPKATCPDKLEAKVGATTRCSMTFTDGRLGITVKVTSVDGDRADFDIQADEQLQR
jgi:hypothetical protein